MLFIISFLLLCIGFRERKKLDKKRLYSSRPLHRIIFHSGRAWPNNTESYQLDSWFNRDVCSPALKRAGAGMHQFFQSTLLNFTLLNKQRKNQKALSKRDTILYLKIIEGLYGQ